MNKFQNISFKSVDEFQDFLPDHELEIVELLRKIIIESIPECKERLAYNVPFFYKHKRICYVWPSSVPWGNVKLKGVSIGFTNGYLLHDEIGYLEKGTRKQVYTKTFHSVSEVNIDLLKVFLFEAAEIDKHLHKKK